MLLFKGWPRRIGVAITALLLIGAAIVNRDDDGPKVDAAHVSSCATAFAWNQTAAAKAAYVAFIMDQSATKPTDGSYRTAIAAADRVITIVGPAPTMLTEWWGAYATMINWTTNRIEKVLAGTLEAANFDPVEGQQMIDHQDSALATFNAACSAT